MNPLTPATLSPSALGDGLRLEVEPAASAGDGFRQALGKALASVDSLQVAGDRQAAALAEGHGNLHETAIALSQAEVGMHFLLKVRNKVVDAYQDIMKMSV